jgi:hypothetical protein
MVSNIVLKSEDVIKLIRQEMPVMEPDATNIATKLIRALNRIDNTKLNLRIESLKSRQNHEKVMHFGADFSKQGISPTLPTRGRQIRTGSSRSSEMIFAIEVLRQELHRSTGIILDTLISQMKNSSNDPDVKGLLELHKQSFVTLHESLKSSWMATNEIEELIRQSKERDVVGIMSRWITKWTASLLGAVIGSMATTVFGMSLNSRNEPQLCDISSWIHEGDMSPSRQNKGELCSRCKHSKDWISKNDALDIGEDSDLARNREQSTHRIGFEGPTLPSAKSPLFHPDNANHRVTSSSSSVYAANHIYSGPAQESPERGGSYLVRCTSETSELKKSNMCFSNQLLFHYLLHYRLLQQHPLLVALAHPSVARSGVVECHLVECHLRKMMSTLWICGDVVAVMSSEQVNTA